MSEQKPSFTDGFRSETVKALEALYPFYDLKGNEHLFLKLCTEAREVLSSPFFKQDHPTIVGLLGNELKGETPCVERVMAQLIGAKGRSNGMGLNVYETITAWLLKNGGNMGHYGKHLDDIRNRKHYPPLIVDQAAKLCFGLIIVRRGAPITKGDYAALDALVDYRMGDKPEFKGKRINVKPMRTVSANFQGVPEILAAKNGDICTVPISRTIDGKTFRGDLTCRVQYGDAVVLLPYFPKIAKIAFAVAKRRKVAMDADGGMTLYCATYEEIATAYAGNGHESAVKFVKEALDAMRKIRLCDIELSGDLWNSDAFIGVPNDTALFPSEPASVLKYGKRTAGELIHGVPLFCRMDDGLDRTVDLRVGGADDDTGVRPQGLKFTQINESIYSILEDRLIQLSRTYKTNPRIVVADILEGLDRLGLLDGGNTDRGARKKRQDYTETIERILQHWVDHGMAYVKTERDGKRLTAFELAMPYCPTRAQAWMLPSTAELIKQHNATRKKLETEAADAAKKSLLDEEIKRRKKYSDEEAAERLKAFTQKHLNTARKAAMQRAVFARPSDIIDAEEEAL